MIDLIQLWINTIKGEKPNVGGHPGSYPNNTSKELRYFDMSSIQSSFEFPESPNIFFVKDIKTLEVVARYIDLPKINLTHDEEWARLNVLKAKRAEGFTDTKQIIITAIGYDEGSNSLYIEAKKVYNSFIITLINCKFPQNSSLYDMKYFRAAVFAPLITHDGTKALLRKSEYGVYSFSCGSLTIEDSFDKAFERGGSFIIKRALEQINEEILDIGNLHAYFRSSEPKITAVSIRFTESGLPGNIEFIAPSFLDCNSSYLQKILTLKYAKNDLPYVLMPLDSQERDNLLKQLLTGEVRLPGASLYIPAALSLTRMANQETRMMSLPRTIPNNPSVAWPLSIFSAKPQKPITMLAEEDVDSAQEGFNLIS